MRTCGTCTACCFFTNGAGSDTYSLCKHCDKGCTIYENRPVECVTFECLWLKQVQVPDELRPDKCGVMFEIPYGSDVCVGHIKNKDDWKHPNVGLFIKKILLFGHSVVIYDNPIHYALTEGDTFERVKQNLDKAKAA